MLRTEERPATAADAVAPLLGIEGLTLEVATDAGPVRLVEEVSFAIGPGEVLGLVGESGCGKSVTAMSVLRLLPEPPTRIASGAIRFRGLDLARADRRTLKAIRGREIGMIFQEPMTSLNPAFSVGWQLAEALRLHTDLRRGALRERLVEVLRQVGIGAPERRLAQYPHELSGGLRQRVMIAMALACGPKLLIADEPTTALDVTVQLQILELIARLRRETGLAVLLITHDLGLVAEYADRVAVMYAGRIVETGAGRRPLRPPAPPLHGGPARRPAAPARTPRGPGRDPRHGPLPSRAAAGLPLPAPLPPPARALRRDAAAGRCRRARRGLLEPGVSAEPFLAVDRVSKEYPLKGGGHAARRAGRELPPAARRDARRRRRVRLRQVHLGQADPAPRPADLGRGPGRRRGAGRRFPTGGCGGAGATCR